MKKVFYSLAVLGTCAAMVVAPVYVFAQQTQSGGESTGQTQSGGQPTQVQTLQNPLQVTSIGALVENLVEIFSYIVVLIAVLLLVYVGFRYVLARGDSAAIKKLHEWLLWIVVGLAIVIGARLIVEVVINTLSATGSVSPQIIHQAQNAVQIH